MDRLQSMAVFVAVGEEESFSAAARRLGMSPPRVTRIISALEAHLGTKLLQRTTRYVRVTDAGQRYLDDARRIIAEADEADEAAAGINAAARGHLSVTAPVMFGRLFVAPGILDYLNRYPDVQVSALFLDRVVNMLEEGVDVAVRLGDLPDSSLRAITVGHVRRLVCASPEYLSVHGTPQRPPELTPHLLITSTTISSATEWKFLLDGHPYVQKITPRLTVSNNDAALEAALSGFGITRLMSYQVASHIEAGRLQVILQTFETAEIPIQVVHRENRYGSAKVRSFIDLMVERLRTDPRLSAMS